MAPKPNAGPSPSESRNTIKPYKPSEHVKRTRSSGRNTAADQGSRALSRKRVRAFGLRRSRYRGMNKTHLQHLVTAAVINLVRTLDWLDGKPLAKTRTSKFAALALAA